MEWIKRCGPSWYTSWIAVCFEMFSFLFPLVSISHSKTLTSTHEIQSNNEQIHIQRKLEFYSYLSKCGKAWISVGVMSSSLNLSRKWNLPSQREKENLFEQYDERTPSARPHHCNLRTPLFISDLRLTPICPLCSFSLSLSLWAK